MNIYTRRALSAAAMIQLLVCGTSFSAHASALTDQMDGVFVSDGYGYVVDLRKDTQNLYHLSGNTCVLDEESSAALPALLTPETVVLTADRKQFAFGNPFEPHKTIFNRVERLPAPCVTPVANTPQENFEAFAAVLANQYAFFDLYGVQWSAQVEAARPLVTPSTSHQELFALFEGMIAPIHDAHLSLNAEIDGSEFSASPSTSVLKRGAQQRALETGKSTGEIFFSTLSSYLEDGVADKILNGEGHEVAGGKVRYGIIDGTVGYINVLMMMGYSSDEFITDSSEIDEAVEYEIVNAIMDEIMKNFADAEVNAVIIDASINFGGSDFMGREIAARFADQKRLAYTKRAFDAAKGSATSVYITPSKRPSFTGPVYLMTTDSTVSAGEVMAMSLRALPNVTHIGQPTAGALSDILNKTLPNGWALGLSNEVYQDHEGNEWEGRGIMPDVSLEIFTETDLVDTHPAAVEAVLARIKTDLGG